jgi:hypothetical protein
MAQRAPLVENDENEIASEQFLQSQGIIPLRGRFSERQLARELMRRGWRWSDAGGRVEATKAHTATGTVSTVIVSQEPNRLTALAAVLMEAIRFDEQKGIVLAGSIEADIVIQAPDHRVIAIAEVKGGESVPADLAARFRANLISHSRIYALAPFFLMIWQNVGYLWDQRPGVDPTQPATQVFPMAAVVSHYLPWRQDGERLSSTELGLATARWLDHLANPLPQRDAPRSPVLEGTDFLDSIQGASIMTDGLE